MSNFRQYHWYHKLCRSSQVYLNFDHHKFFFKRHLNIWEYLHLKSARREDSYILNSIFTFQNQKFGTFMCAGLNWLIRIWWGHETELQRHLLWKFVHRRVPQWNPRKYTIPEAWCFSNQVIFDQYAVLWRALGEIFLVVYWEMELKYLRIIFWIRLL